MRRKHREHHHWGRFDAHEGLDTKAQQHARQHRRGDRHRNTVHQPLKQPCRARKDDQHCTDDESPDRLCHRQSRNARGAGCDQRGTRRGPGRDHRLFVVKRRQDRGQPHAEPQRPDPGIDLRLIGPQRLRRLKHQRTGAGEADEDDDEAGDDGGEGQIAEEGHAVQGRKANAIVAERCSGSLAAARIMPAWHQSISGHSTLW